MNLPAGARAVKGGGDGGAPGERSARHVLARSAPARAALQPFSPPSGGFPAARFASSASQAFMRRAISAS